MWRYGWNRKLRQSLDDMTSRLILGLNPANEKRRYKATIEKIDFGLIKTNLYLVMDRSLWIYGENQREVLGVFFYHKQLRNIWVDAIQRHRLPI